MAKSFVNIPIFIPELACPNRCVFCNQETISGYSAIPQPEDISKIIDEYLSTIDSSKCRVHIAFFGGSFTGIPEELQNNYLSAAEVYLKSNRVHGIHLSTRPDYISEETIIRLKSYGVKCIELGAQSMDEEVLKLTNRNHTTEDVESAAKIIKQHGIELGLQMMIGLPGDTKDKSIYTANTIAGLKADNTRIYPCLVIKGTALEQLYRKGLYKPLRLEEAIDWTKDILPIFEANNITVLRTGLHPSDEFEDPDSLIAGPYHPAFKALVLSSVWADKFEKLKSSSNSLRIHINPSDLNFAVGHKQSNKKELMKKYKDVKFIPDRSIERGDYKLAD